MTAPALPASSADITVEWLNEALGAAGVIGDATVRSFEREVIGEEAGFVGELTRISLTYDRPDAQAPASIISKLPTDDDAFRNLALLLGLYEREIRFYQEIAWEVELRTPECYYSAMDPSAGRYVLLLEDLAPARCGDQLVGCSLEEAELALTEIAKFHAAWWSSPRLATFDWMLNTSDPNAADLLATAYRQSWPAFVEENRDLVPPAIIDIGERFGASFDSMMREYGDGPQSIVHTDFRLDNMFFDLPDGSPLAVIDWQLTQQGSPLIDVVYFLAGNLPPDARRKHEKDLLRSYHETLLQNGVADYDFEACEADYRAAALVLLLFLVTDRDNQNIDDYGERAQRLLHEITHRYSAAILDLNAAEFLPG